MLRGEINNWDKKKFSSSFLDKIFLSRCPELTYFGTFQSGIARKDRSDLFPFTAHNAAAFGSRSNRRVVVALRQAEELCPLV